MASKMDQLLAVKTAARGAVTRGIAVVKAKREAEAREAEALREAHAHKIKTIQEGWAVNELPGLIQVATERGKNYVIVTEEQAEALRDLGLQVRETYGGDERRMNVEYMLKFEDL